MADPQPTKSFVLVISGVPGSGKSTLIRNVAEALGPAVTLHFDDYGATSIYPEDFKTWLRSGASLDDWQTPQLVRDLCSLQAGAAVPHPRTGVFLEPQPVIIIEEPFGRARPEMSATVDFAAHISLPLDLALIRVLKRMLAEDAAEAEEKRQGCSAILDTLSSVYSDGGMRGVFVGSDRHAAQSADIVLDGTRTPEDLKAELIEALKRRQADGTR